MADKQYQVLNAVLSLKPVVSDDPMDLLKNNMPTPAMISVPIILRWQVLYWSDTEAQKLHAVINALLKLLVKYDQGEFIMALAKGVEGAIPGRFFILQVGNKAIEHSNEDS